MKRDRRQNSGLYVTRNWIPISAKKNDAQQRPTCIEQATYRTHAERDTVYTTYVCGISSSWLSKKGEKNEPKKKK